MMQSRHMPAQCHLLNGGPCESCSKLEDIDRQLDAADVLIHRLLIERREILGQVNQRHDPFILRLPTELASRVFQLCVSMDEETGEECMLDKHAYGLRWSAADRKVGMPHVLGMVCHQWREIAAFTPQLWTTIPIFVLDDQKRMVNQLELIKQWAKWSGSLHLSVGLWDRNGACARQMKESEIPAMLLSVLDFVNYVLSRCKCLHIHLPIRALPHLTGNGESLEHLQEFRIGTADPLFSRTSIRRVIGDHQLFDRTGIKQPSPRSVVLTSLPYDIVSVTWSNVVDLSVALLLASDIVAILRAAPRLEKLAVRRAIMPEGHSTNPQEQLPHVVHDCLRSLTTDNASTVNTPLFWDLFTFPALTELDYYDHQNHDSFLALLSRSKCRVTTVSLSSTFSEQDTTQFFRLLPFLIKLNLTVGDTTPAERVMQALAQHVDGSDGLAPLPQLQRVAILLVLYPPYIDLEKWWISLLAFLETVTRDDRPNTSLKTFRATFKYPVSKMPAPPHEVSKHLPLVVARAARKGVDVSLVDDKGDNLLEHYAQRLMVDNPLNMI